VSNFKHVKCVMQKGKDRENKEIKIAKISYYDLYHRINRLVVVRK